MVRPGHIERRGLRAGALALLAALALNACSTSWTAQRQPTPRTAPTVQPSPPPRPAPRPRADVRLVLRDQVLEVRTRFPASWLPPGLKPSLDLGSLALTRPLELARQGDELVLDVRLPVVDADHFEPASDLTVLPSASPRGFLVTLASVVPAFVDAQGRTAWLLPGARVTAELGRGPHATSLRASEGAFSADSPEELYGGRLLSGPGLAQVELDGLRFASLDWSAAELDVLAQEVHHWRTELQRRLGALRRLDLLVIGRMNAARTTTVGNATATNILLNLHLAPAGSALRYGMPTVHELTHFALPDGLERGATEALTELLSLRIAAGDDLAPLLRHRWAMRRPLSAGEAQTLERYYAGPVVALCSADVKQLEALVRDAPWVNGRKQVSAPLRALEAQLARDLPRASGWGDDFVDACLTRLGASAPVVPGLRWDVVKRRLGVVLSSNPGNERGVRVVESSSPVLRVGDVLARVADEPILDAETLQVALARHAGKAVRLQLWRGDGWGEATVQLPLVQGSELEPVTRWRGAP